MTSTYDFMIQCPRCLSVTYNDSTHAFRAKRVGRGAACWYRWGDVDCSGCGIPLQVRALVSETLDDPACNRIFQLRQSNEAKELRKCMFCGNER